MSNLSSTIFSELSALDTDIHCILMMTPATDQVPELINVIIDSIDKRINIISNSIIKILTTENTSDKVIGFMTGLVSSIISKLVYKTVISCNKDIGIQIILINKLNNRNDGIEENLFQYLDAINKFQKP